MIAIALFIVLLSQHYSDDERNFQFQLGKTMMFHHQRGIISIIFSVQIVNRQLNQKARGGEWRLSSKSDVASASK
jgi:hypothetical protein